jgi:hypothetical protein
MHHDEPFVSCALRRDHQWRDGREGFRTPRVASKATSAGLLWENFPRTQQRATSPHDLTKTVTDCPYETL